MGGTLNDSLTIKNSTVHDVGVDGALVEVATNGLVDNNVVYNTGSAAVSLLGGYTSNGTWEWFCSTCTTQNNETYDTHSNGGVDGGDYDIDTQNSNVTFQYNYGHDADGYCLGVFASDNINTVSGFFRYNVCANNSRDTSKASEGDVLIWTPGGGDTAALNGVSIYNNTFYWNPASSGAYLLNNVAAFTGSNPDFFRNNLIYAAGNKFVDSNSSLLLNNNLYYTTSASSPVWTYAGTSYNSISDLVNGSNQELTGQYADPKLNTPTYHSTGKPTTQFTLQSTSPAIDNGINVCVDISGCSMGSQDFFGTSLFSGSTYDIGANESSYTGGAGSLLFLDDFENLGTSSWSTTNGTWSNCQPSGHSHQLCLTGTSAGTRYTALAGSSWSNYSVKAYVNPVTTSDYSAGVIARAQDVSNYYMLTIAGYLGSTTWNIYKVVSNTATLLNSGSFSQSWPLYLKLDVNGSTLTGSYSTNDSSYTTLGSATDSTFSSGEIGVRAYGTDCNFDAVRVVKD
jgi:hypothetical protein